MITRQPKMPSQVAVNLNTGSCRQLIWTGELLEATRGLSILAIRRLCWALWMLTKFKILADTLSAPINNLATD